LVKDVIAGFFILLEGQFSVGDQVTVSGFTGTVDELGLRSTRIRDTAGDIFIIPNGSILNLVNHSLLPRSFFVSGIFPAETDSGKLLQTFDMVGKKAQEDFSLAQTPAASVSPVQDDGGHSFRLKVVSPSGSVDILEQEIPYRLTLALKQAGVEVPELEIIKE